MFKTMTEEHKTLQQQKRQQMKELENRIVNESIPTLSDAIFSELNEGSTKIVENQKEIDQRCRAVKAEWQNFNNELGKWAQLIDNLDREIKQIGDVRSWSQQIQTEVEAIIQQLSNKNQS
ncbi:biogenesis of lysosome-related organelles complex 1 subunit 1 [Histomonas meleagridis]|uniref:biogenesis of lysosome-related organelles complex 1 subunit 1 n=1 Tax=Histomonas meleagridis TaxID=135588 RepID=UPI00355A6B57|nr:biogenesis of lysosome-related organelles complex 1 subunit 1 [Histomonas meleagridis]KAH0797601.1 biogenesis of lysosome-related organelles complex 1 subunit 1 [Histomonas meleagridis]